MSASSPAAAAAAAAASSSSAVSTDMTYEFDCPQYRDFNAPEDEHADAWFGAPATDATSTEQFNGDASAADAIPAAMVEEEPVKADAKVAEPAVELVEAQTEVAQPIAAEIVAEPVAEVEVAPVEAAVAPIGETVAAVVASIVEAPIVVAVEAEADAIMQESKAAEEDVMIAATIDSAAFVAAVAESGTDAEHSGSAAPNESPSRASMVFGSLRCSLPLLGADAQSLISKSESFKQTDDEAKALHESFESAVNASPITEAPEQSAVNESCESITQQLAAQFAAVADSPRSSLTIIAAPSAIAALMKRTPSASPSRRGVEHAAAAGATGSQPSYLRPTAAALSRAQKIAEDAAAVRAGSEHITRRPITLVRDAPAAPVSLTPKVTKKRVADQARLDELARPRTATKATTDEPEEHFSRPRTASKTRASSAHAHAAAAGPYFTVAQSPALMTRARAKVNHKPAIKTTEDEEVEKVAEAKLAVAAMLKRNAALFDKISHLKESCEVSALPIRSASNVTQPKEFEFHTSKRARIQEPTAAIAAAAPSSAASAAKETPRMGEPTQVRPFKLSTSRALRRESHVVSREEQELLEMKALKPFKATPAPEAILHAAGPIGVPKAQKIAPTQATSPQLLTKERSKRKQGDDDAAVAPASGSAPVAAAAGASVAKKLRREVQPFCLATEQRGSRATEVFQSNVEAELAREREAHNFHARAIGAAAPAAAASAVPLVPHCVELHREARAKFESKIQESEAAARQAREFHARPNPFTGAVIAESDVSMVPAIKSDRPLTVPVTPALKSKARHAQREAFDESMRAREEQLKKLTEQHAEEEEARKAKELTKVRASMKPATVALNHRILEAPTFVAQPSKLPLTQPESPMLITKRRGQAAMRRMSTVAQEGEDAADQEHEQQENIVPVVFTETVMFVGAITTADVTKVAVAQSSEPVEGNLLGEIDSNLPLAAQFNAVASE